MIESSVRLAAAADVNEIISLVGRSYKEEPPIPLKFDDNAVFSLLLRALQGKAVTGVIANGSGVESSCYVNIATPWYSSDPVIESLWSYSLPEHQKSSNSKTMLVWERRQAERLNCPLQTSVPITEANKPRIALYERIFGPRSGVSFYYHPAEEISDLEGPQVVPADLKDLPEILEVARELGRENGAYTVSEDVAIPMIRDVIAGDGIVGIVRAEDGNIAGTILLKIAYYWGSSQPFADEYWLHVREQYRKSNIARQLIQFAKHQADKLGLLLRIGIISKIELSRKLALYTRHLGEPAVAHFSWRPA